MVTVFHDGIHTCVARHLFELSEEVKEKISSGGTTITKSTEDAIIDCLKEGNPCWNDVYEIVILLYSRKNSTMSNKKQMLNIFLMVIVLIQWHHSDLNSLERILSLYSD